VSTFPSHGRYNQLLRIEEELGARAVYAGEAFRNPAGLIVPPAGRLV
jgi:hypothetical protein